MNRRVVVTGLGVVSPYGLGCNCFWEGISNGHSAIKLWKISGVDNFPVRYAASIDLEDLQGRYPAYFTHHDPFDRRSRFAFAAAQLAMADAGIESEQLHRVGVFVGSGVPEADDATLTQLGGQPPKKALAHLIKHRQLRISAGCSLRCSNDALSAAIARQFGATGPVVNVSGACAGASQAIGLGFKAIKRNEADAMLVGGGDSVLNVRTLSALYSLGATSTTQRFGDALCRPFDRGRSGLVAGEGGAILLLEEHNQALNRGAKIYGEILGYGSSLDAYKVTAPHPQGAGALMSMRRALEDARLHTNDIDYINAHGTSTPLNDIAETAAIKSLFAKSIGRLRVSSTKSMIGHWIAAAGAPEAIATLLAINNQCIPPTINLEDPDDGCDLNYVSESSQQAELTYCLSNSFGFGGINATLTIGRFNNDEK